MSAAHIVCEVGAGNERTFSFWIKGLVRPPIHVFTKALQLGTCPVHLVHVISLTKKSEIRFANYGKEIIQWRIEHKSTTYEPAPGFKPPPLSSKIHQLESPVNLLPSSGYLHSGESQSVEVRYNPSFAQYASITVLELHSEDFHTTQITVFGTGASSILDFDDFDPNFGVIRVGQTKHKELLLRNNGMLPLHYFVQFTPGKFTAEPEQGVISPAQCATVHVRFVPKTGGFHESMLKITSFAKDPSLHIPHEILLSGKGSYPDLLIETKLVDFNIALYKSANRRPIVVENKGDADAILTFACIHPHIKIESDTNDLVIGAQSKKEIYVVYTPQVVEKLNSRIFISSSDNRGDSFMIAMKGNVGIPRLCIVKPEGGLDNLKFGVMRLNKLYQKTFSILNDGTIYLNYSIVLTPKSISHVSSEIEKGLGIKKVATNIPNPITITPSEGHIGVGEEVPVTVQFLPTMLLEYEYDITIKYDFKTISGTITGTGGRALLCNDNALTCLDFGISRVGKVYRKSFSFTNRGNLGFYYIIRPQPEDGDWSRYNREIASQIAKDVPDPINDIQEPIWATELEACGYTLVNDHGFCPANGKLIVQVEFRPIRDKTFRRTVRIFYSDKYEEFELQGSGASPSLCLNDSKTGKSITTTSVAELDLGIHPVKTTYVHYSELVNTGPFPVDFLIEPLSAAEFEVFPSRGYIEAGQSIQMQLYFEPLSENKFSTLLRVLWEGNTIKTRLVGTGGVGRLEIAYANEKDNAAKSLDFGMVPFHSSYEKEFFLMNHGLVGVYCTCVVENEDYYLTQFGDLFYVADKNKSTPRGILKWAKNLKVYLPPSTGLKVAVQYIARSATISNSDVTIKSEGGSFIVPLRGKGGTISLSHKSDLAFGDISCNYTYTRKISIVNGGSIPAQLSAGWLVVGHSSEHSLPLVQLSETYSVLDPRSQWARKYYFESNKLHKDHVLKSSDYWRLIAIMTRRNLINPEFANDSSDAGGKKNTVSGKGKRMGPLLSSSNSSLTSDSILKRPGKHNMSPYFKRRQMFYHLISSEALSSQSASKVRPHIKVSPPIQHLPSYGEATFTIDLNLSTEDTFLATLVIKPDVPNTQSYEIALAATPKLVSIYCDDTRTLNFYRQPIGETELIYRNFTNIGHKDVPFKLLNSNPALAIMPAKGTLKVGQTIEITFAFKPVDESLQTSDVLFEPANSQPIRFKMYGGGGYAKPSLARYRRFDFGHCMIGKDTISSLPITNDGNAILHLTRFELQDTETFFRGQDWPRKRISLAPGDVYNLPLVFCPHEENPIPGKLLVGTNSELYEIELIGYGREAVLIVSKVALEFSECIIRNSYEQKFSLKNIGDVNYPVTFQLEKVFPDLEFKPNALTINPFSESFVTVTYRPSHETKSTVVLTISSPYSVHKVPISIHAGFVALGFDKQELDFGMFERTTKPSLMLNIFNEGTVKTSVSLKDSTKPPLFNIVPAKGFLLPGKSMEVKVTHIQHDISQFEEKILIKTDLNDRPYFIKAKGQCEETVLIPDEFCLMNMGICPVLETTTKPLQFINHGKFPLTFQIKNSYPLKVTPTQGIVKGTETGSVQVSWSPSGAYELRTQVQMITNIGQFHIIVRAKAMFPELLLSSTYLDFGVCAIGYSYRETVTLENKGKVPLRFNVPPCKDLSYSTNISSGVLAPKETIQLQVIFSPMLAGKIASSIVVECKGIHYKEIIVIGMGGQMKIESHPKAISLGRCPFGLTITQVIGFRNLGDVTLYIDFSKTLQNQNNCIIYVPEPISIPPNRTANCQVGFKAVDATKFSCMLVYNTREAEYTIPVTGSGIKIVLSAKSKLILEREYLETLHVIDPTTTEPEHNQVDLFMKTFSKSFSLDMEIVQFLTLMYDRENRKRRGSVLGSLESRLALNSGDSNEGNDLGQNKFNSMGEKSATITELEETPKPIESSIDMPKSQEPEPIKEQETEQNDIKLYSGDTENGQSVLEVEQVLDINPTDTVAESAETSTSKQENLPVLPEKQPLSETTEEVVHEGSLPLQEGFREPVAQIAEPEPFLTKEELIYKRMMLKKQALLEKIQNSQHIDADTFASQFNTIKLEFVAEEKPVQDPIIQQIIEYGQLKVQEIDLSPVLQDVEPQTEINLYAITCRPNPLPAQKKTTIIQAVDHKRSYITHFQPIDRKKRNARSNPLG